MPQSGYEQCLGLKVCTVISAVKHADIGSRHDFAQSGGNNFHMRRPIHAAAILGFTAMAAFSTPVFAKDAKTHFKIDQANFQKLNPQEQQRVLEIGARWDAISNMDRSQLDKSDRKELRSEVRSLKAEAKTYNRNGTAIYLSTGAIIIIILLLILIL